MNVCVFCCRRASWPIHVNVCVLLPQGILDDEEALRRMREEERAKAASERLAEAYAELKQGSKAQDMKEQELMRLQMQVCALCKALQPGLGTFD